MNTKGYWTYLLAVFISVGLFLWPFITSISFSQKEKLDSTVLEGKKVWQQKNCVECHSLLGNGGYNATDLTEITSRRSSKYLKQYLLNPPSAIREQKHPELTSSQAGAVIKYLNSVKNTPSKNWPPKPLKLDSNLGG